MLRPSVFEFLDYREYLMRYYEWKKATTPSFSYRAFSRRVGLKSPNHLKRVIEGERGLTNTMAERYTKGLGLEGREEECFHALVDFCEAETQKQRQDRFQRLAGLRGYNNAQKLDYRYAQYYEHWFIPAVHELANFNGFRAEPEWIAKQMMPPITTHMAQTALDVLGSLGMLVVEDGKLVRKSPIVTTGREALGEHLRSYHEVMLGHASAAIQKIDKDDRDISSVTFAVGEDGMARLKDEMARLRRELIAWATEEEKNGKRVVHVTFAAVPLSRELETDK